MMLTAQLRAFGLAILVGSLITVRGLEVYVFLPFRYISQKKNNFMIYVCRYRNTLHHKGSFEYIQIEGRLNNVGDLKKQPYYIFLHYTYPFHSLALGVLLYTVGGLPFLVWGLVNLLLITVYCLIKP